MDAYILGTHEGALPTQLLSHGEAGHRVRTIGALEGPTHNIFYALEVPDLAAYERIAGHIKEAGTTAGSSVGPSAHPEYVMIKHLPSHMPPWDRILLAWLEVEREATEEINKAIAAAVADLGEDGVAIAADSDGGVLVEFGGDDAGKVDAAAAAFASSVGGLPTGIHALSSDGFATA